MDGFLLLLDELDGDPDEEPSTCTDTAGLPLPSGALDECEPDEGSEPSLGWTFANVYRHAFYGPPPFDDAEPNGDEEDGSFTHDDPVNQHVRDGFAAAQAKDQLRTMVGPAGDGGRIDDPRLIPCGTTPARRPYAAIQMCHFT